LKAKVETLKVSAASSETTQSVTMKIFQLALLVTVANAFTATTLDCCRTAQSSTALNLFGTKKESGDKGPGFMDQMAMFKKAQEMASKKQKLDEELKLETFEGVSSNGKVKASFKFVPVKNPMDPNPDYDAISFDFDDEFFQSASPEELSAAVTESIADGIAKTNVAVAQKYAVLQADLIDALGQGKKQQ
jgi:YbaB/EbfC DNA-binding family